MAHKNFYIKSKIRNFDLKINIFFMYNARWVGRCFHVKSSIKAFSPLSTKVYLYHKVKVNSYFFINKHIIIYFFILCKIKKTLSIYSQKQNFELIIFFHNTIITQVILPLQFLFTFIFLPIYFQNTSMPKSLVFIKGF